MRWAAVLVISAAAIAPAAAEKTRDYTFAYTYPPAAARIPALKRMLDTDRATRRARVAADAAADRRQARGDYVFRPWDVTTEWKLVADTPRFLSLSAERYAFTGGAHGMTVSEALVWDKAAGRRLAPRDLFTSPAAIQRAVGSAYCRALDRERARKRGEPVKRGAWPNQCVPTKDATLLLGSHDGRVFDRVGLIADAYVAGPYAEGPYEVTLPVTPALLAAVKPAYRKAFAAR